MRFRVALVLMVAACAYGLDYRKSPAEYPLQLEASDFKAGVEYMVRSFLSESQTFTVDDYLLVEIGVYPDREANVDVRRFSLRLNGKDDLLPHTPGTVAASIKYPDWRRKPSLEAHVGMPGSGGVVLGRTPSVGRFPGDPSTRYPRQESAPTTPRSAGNEPEYEQLVKRHSLPEGKMNRPVAGYLYFPYTGKLKSLKSVELLVDGVPLKLR